jgi:conjugal transfer ATP-binding protein TraC
MINKLLEALFGPESSHLSVDDRPRQRQLKNLYDFNSLSNLLHYRYYDDDNAIYHNNQGYGFILEAELLVGSNDALEKDLGTLFKDILPAGSSMQFLLLASNKTNSLIASWQDSYQRASFPILKDMAAARADFFRKHSRVNYGSEPYLMRDYRLLISWSKPGQGSESEVRKAVNLMQQIQALFTANSMPSKPAPAGRLIKLLHDFVQVKREDEGSYDYDFFQTLNYQVLPRELKLAVAPEHLTLDDDYALRCLNVKKLPSEWYLYGMSEFLGAMFNERSRYSCSFALHFGVHIVNNENETTAKLLKASNVEKQALSPLGKLVPALRKEAAEWSFVREKLEQGERFVKSQLQVILLDHKNQITDSEQRAKSLFKSKGFELEVDRHLQLPAFLSILPLSWGAGALSNQQYFRRLRTSLSHESVHLLPIQGEYRGSNNEGMLLAGRRGQLCRWLPFAVEGGNYNASVVGESGAGKSVFMQELASSILGIGGKVFVLDIGRSFEKQAKLCGGQFIEFARSSNLCLNPFSSIDARDQDSVENSLALLKPVLAQMIAPKSDTTDEEDAIISQALRAVWQAKGNNAAIDDIISYLEQKPEPLFKKLARGLDDYSSQGIYGKFFNGKGNVDLRSAMVVMELQDIQGTSLQGVVVQLFMLLVSNKVFAGDRKTPVAIVFDEAWQMLQGKQGGKFIEILARTLRKFNGSLVVGTQSLRDFEESPAAKAAYENSAWLCMLKQKSETIERMSENGQFAANGYMKKLYKSLRSKSGEFSEVAILHDNVKFVGRLILDPFSRVLYSTKPAEYMQVQDLVKQGYSMQEAISKTAEQLYGEDEL